MKFMVGEKTMDFTEDEVHKLLSEFHKHGFHAAEGNANHYWQRAKDNIAKLVDDPEMPIETEKDAKKILSHCLGLSCREADLLYEIIEFAIGMRMVHTEDK